LPTRELTLNPISVGTPVQYIVQCVSGDIQIFIYC